MTLQLNSGIRFEAEPAKEYVSEQGKVLWIITAHAANETVVLAKCVVMNSSEYSRLMTLFVHPQIRRQALGSQILEFACNYVVSESNPVYIEADSFDLIRSDKVESSMMTDEQLKEFYQRHGFVSVAGHPFSLVRAARTPKS